jgi:predicted permease
MTAPITYSFLWLTIFGGAGIKTERLAAGAGLCCPSWNSTVLGWNDTTVSFHVYWIVSRVEKQWKHHWRMSFIANSSFENFSMFSNRQEELLKFLFRNISEKNRQKVIHR